MQTHVSWQCSAGILLSADTSCSLHHQLCPFVSRIHATSVGRCIVSSHLQLPQHLFFFAVLFCLSLTETSNIWIGNARWTNPLDGVENTGFRSTEFPIHQHAGRAFAIHLWKSNRSFFNHAPRGAGPRNWLARIAPYRARFLMLRCRCHGLEWHGLLCNCSETHGYTYYGNTIIWC